MFIANATEAHVCMVIGWHDARLGPPIQIQRHIMIETSVSKVARPPDKPLVEFALDVLLCQQTRSAGQAQNVVIIHLNKHTLTITNT